MTAVATDRRRDTASRLLLTLARWTGAAAIVCGVHAGAVWLAIHWRPVEAAAGEPPPAVMMELAPLAVAPEAPPQEVAPGPQMTEAEPEPAPPEPQVERVPVDDTPPPPEPEPEIRIPDLPPMPDAAAVLTPPPPPPPRQVEPPRPVQRVERPRPVRPDRTRVRQTTAPPTAQAQRADAAAAPSAGAASSTSSASPASWRGSLMAHLNRFKRFPSGASTGVAQVAFTIDRSGRVLSSRLVRGSGDSALDNEAVSMMRRASPVPAPPASVAGGSITLAVPVRFNR
ncbi:energy transducer TonB family protein [Phreatobacter stygius]|uniref:Energy transducer TonB n=1 Tax=Phreatobacter stygius TaxID=1940610 RepID=A0A4D7AWY7_9HYPH|nr:TonB family protein [Phreatobacter stygius]QCI64015.1 energy transducer TonB [Phreatobacter stygius]